MVIYMKVNLKMEKKKEKVSKNGPMVKVMKAILKMEIKKEKE